MRASDANSRFSSPGQAGIDQLDAVQEPRLLGGEAKDHAGVGHCEASRGVWLWPEPAPRLFQPFSQAGGGIGRPLRHGEGIVAPQFEAPVALPDGNEIEPVTGTKAKIQGALPDRQGGLLPLAGM